ncbi:ATP-binding protein [Aliiglaciecola sp.]|nr:ATP-binding protein [Aliiglaciecola sp.]
MKKNTSLEHQFKIASLVLLALPAAMLGFILYLLGASWLVVSTCYLLFIPMIVYVSRLYRQVIDPFFRLTSQVESIRLEDYSQRMQSRYKTGIARDLVIEINKLSEDLQTRKSRYDQHVFLIYRLIEQLDTPILVIDPNGKLSHANSAFSTWHNTPWQTLKGTSVMDFGLQQVDHGWRLNDQQQNKRWQLRHSHFHQDGDTYQLVILTNIEKELSAAEQDAWRRLIRVLGHEIRNSLTPIKSLAQSLQQMPFLQEHAQGERIKQALHVIVERSVGLQDFVERYANLSKEFKLNQQYFSATELTNKLKVLNPQQVIEVNIAQDKVWGDPILLEQVMINLIKNAAEAAEKESPINLQFLIKDGQQKIRVVDQGKGIQNPDNLFVPFYTTKPSGQGIGLTFCRNIIEQHGGTLQLTNNVDTPGATAEISLPLA